MRQKTKTTRLPRIKSLTFCFIIHKPNVRVRKKKNMFEAYVKQRC